MLAIFINLKNQIKMKTLFLNIKNTMISGIILFLPIFILVAIFTDVYEFLYGFGHKIAAQLGLNKATGLDMAPILTSVLIMLLLYVFGLLVKFSSVTKLKDWVENSLLIYIPNYSKYRAKMMKKLHPGKDIRQPVLVAMNDAWKPGLLVSAENGKSTVFMPSTPDTSYGEVWVVDSRKVSKLNMSPKELKTAILMSGKGLTLS